MEVDLTTLWYTTYNFINIEIITIYRHKLFSVFKVRQRPPVG